MLAFSVTLEDLYLGKQTKFKLDKAIICPQCQGLKNIKFYYFLIR